MKALNSGLCALVLAVAGNAMAQPHLPSGSHVLGSSAGVARAEGSATALARPLSRAEVQADFMLWRQSGLDEFTLHERQDAMPHRYQAALSRYQALRSSAASSVLASGQ